MIESSIKALMSAGISEIYVTVGYKKEKYYYLADKYEGVRFIENYEYRNKNTISSFAAAMDYLKGKNCYVSESDLYIKDPGIIKSTVDKSRYYIRKVPAQDSEWGFNLVESGSRISKIIRPQKDVYLDHHMYGMAYWTSDDLDLIINAVHEAYRKPEHAQLADDEVVNSLYATIDVGVISLDDDKVYEIDSLDDLVAVDSSYLHLLQ